MDQDQSAYHPGVNANVEQYSQLADGCIRCGFLGSASLSNAFSPNTAFQIKPLISGYLLAGDATKSAEGNCGEGKCGIPMMDKDKDGKVSKEESKAGGFSEKQFNAWDANHDGKLDKSELDAFHSVKGKEGYCS